MRLIYHSIPEGRGTSPFDQALQEVALEAPLLRLASPYIGLAFLQRIIGSARDWRILSDVEAWLQSGNSKHRARCWSFIRENRHRVRHVSDLHAKVAIGNKRLFLGSANFTEKGILGRVELSVLVSDLDTVLEAERWFDSLWELASPPILNEGDALLTALESAEWTRPKFRPRLTSTAPKVAATLAETARPPGFDIAAVMARAGIDETQGAISLEAAFNSVSETWASEGRNFSFKEVRSAVKDKASGSFRGIWHLLIPQVSNHWLGGLDPDGYDRFVFANNRFRRVAPETDRDLIRAPAKVLQFILEEIPLWPERRQLPLESAWGGIGIAEAQILPIVELMLDIGFLIEHDDPGEIESYSIEREFDWPSRWKKFGAALALYEQMRKHIRTFPEVSKRSGRDRPIERTIIWNKRAPDPAILSAIEARRMSQEVRVEDIEGGEAAARAAEVDEKVRMSAASEGIELGEFLKRQDVVLEALLQVISEQSAARIPVRWSEVISSLEEVKISDSLLAQFNSETGALTLRDGLLQFNIGWNALGYLARYPRAYAAWVALTTRTQE